MYECDFDPCNKIVCNLYRIASQSQVSTDDTVEGAVTVSTRTDVTGVDSTNTTPIFEINAQSSLETVTKNFTAVM